MTDVEKKSMKKLYDKCVKIYENSKDGQSAVLKYCKSIGHKYYAYCDACELDSPIDPYTKTCLVCGSKVN